MEAKDFAEEFINDAGGGQYFFYPVSCPVETSSGETLQTSRLRTSYIENKYLVMSPLRNGAGQAFLEIGFPDRCPRLEFSCALWSGNEGILQEEFKLQYFDGALERPHFYLTGEFAHRSRLP